MALMWFHGKQETLNHSPFLMLDKEQMNVKDMLYILYTMVLHHHLGLEDAEWISHVLLVLLTFSESY